MPASPPTCRARRRSRTSCASAPSGPPSKGCWSLGATRIRASRAPACAERPGIQQLLQAAADGKIDIILAESLDRLSRDKEDIAHIYKRMLPGVRIVTLSESEVNELHMGLKGTMGALALKDQRTRLGVACAAGSRPASPVGETGMDTTSSRESPATASRSEVSAGSIPSRPRASNASSTTTPGASHRGRSRAAEGRLMRRRELLRMPVRFPP
jgi:hypothetical protein